MTQQLACTYAALILNEVGKTDAKSLQAVAKAAGIEVSQGMATAFASALTTVNISDTLGNMTFGGAAAAPAAAGGAAPAAAAGGKAKKEEKVEEEEGDDDMGFGLFD